MPWFETAPLSLIGLIILVALLAAAEFGYRAHGWLFGKEMRDRSSADEGYLLSAVLGLLALLLGFTFSLSLNRYEARRDLVVQEANAIGTGWLRAQLTDPPVRDRLLRQMQAYADIRIAYSESGDPAQSAAGLAATSAAQHQLWQTVGEAVRADSSQLVARGLMEAVNQSFDAASARTAARQAHIPTRVMNILLLYAVISSAMLGYVLAGSGARHRMAAGLMLTLLTLALTVILDLDRPRDGAIKVPQQPLIDLRASMAIPPAP